MRNDPIKIGFCVAYDWPMLQYALPLVYEAADSICLSVDKDKISWGGEKFPFDQEAFKTFVATIDTKDKITILEEDFHKPVWTPMQNEVHQRNRMAEFMGNGGWHIQLDCDEYFVSFSAFVAYLKELPLCQTTKLNVSCSLITLFKKTSNGFFYVPPTPTAIEFIQIATRQPRYETGRRNGDFNHLTDFIILHQSWARNDHELQQKLLNWGHKSDFNTKQFFEKWQSLDLSNYKDFKNFHPINPRQWPSLAFVTAKSEMDLIKNLPIVNFPLSKWAIILKNNRTISRIKNLLNKVLDKYGCVDNHN